MSETNEPFDVSSKNTKNEILEAYNALLAKIQENKQENRQEVKKQHEENEIIKKASSFTDEHIVKKLAELKLHTNQELDKLEQQMTLEYRQLVDLQSAIKIESNNLQELYEIKKNADSLTALLLAQKEYKQNFEAEIEQKRLLWVREQQEFEQSVKEKALEIKKDRTREEEEYAYNVKLAHKKDKDLYEAQKMALTKELEEQKITFQKEFAEREAAIQSGENELKSLQERVKLFPAELEKAIKDTETATRNVIETRYKHQIDLSTKEIEGERKLNQQIIESLKDKIKEQDEYIQQLTQKANDSTKQVQSIALKAIEGSSNMRFYGSYEDGKKSTQTNQ